MARLAREAEGIETLSDFRLSIPKRERRAGYFGAVDRYARLISKTSTCGNHGINRQAVMQVSMLHSSYVEQECIGRRELQPTRVNTVAKRCPDFWQSDPVKKI